MTIILRDRLGLRVQDCAGSKMASKELLENSAWSAQRGGPGGDSWRQARRHSRLVRVLRVGLPVLTLFIVAGMLLSLRSLPGGVSGVGLGDFGVSGSALTMDNPKLSGHGSRGMAYEVVAARALQDLASPSIVHLESIDGHVDQPEGGWTKLTAAKGVYDSDGETLRLDNHIEVHTHDGKRAFLDEADVNFQTQTVVSDRPVRLLMPSARITADRMEASEGGAKLLLKGRVKVDMRLDGGLLKEDGDAR